LELAPDWDEAHMALGEVYYHLMPSRGALDSLAESEFRTAVARDSTFTPPLVHLGQIAGRRGSVQDMQSIIERFQRVGADESWIRELGIIRDCLRDGAPTRWPVLIREDATAALSAIKAFSGGLAQPGCAEAGTQALLSIEGQDGHRWGALLVRQGSLLARGLASDALRMLDSARASGTSAVLFLYVMDAVAGAPFAERADSVLAFAQRAYGADYERAQLGTPDNRGALALWVVAVWHRVRGEADRVQQIAERLTSAARSAPDNRRLVLIAGAVAGHAALARADTVEAMRLLSALVSTARRDSLTYDHVEALAVERYTLASLLLERREFAAALQVASAFDHPEPVSFLPFLRASLDLRAEAADSLGDSRRASEYRERLSLLVRASGAGPRR
jgi:hypothetical protein